MTTIVDYYSRANFKNIIFPLQNSSMTETYALFCEFKNRLNETVDLFVMNVTDPVQEFWERKALDQSPGVSAKISF